MLTDRKAIVSTAFVFAVAVVATSAVPAGSITGDTFTMTVSEANMLLGGTADGVAGAGPLSVQDFIVVWEDEDTFELDFFSPLGTSLTDLTISLSGLDFTDTGAPVDIIGVTEVRNAFGTGYDLQFDAHSITISHPFLDNFEAADGNILEFDVMTSPPPVGPSILGDTYTVTVSEANQAHEASADGIAGGPPVNPDDFVVEWTDQNTFELDFFSSLGPLEDLTISLTGLDFKDGGVPVDIIGANEVPGALFDWDYNLDIDAHAITITYPFLDNFEAADGNIISFDVVTPLAGDANNDGQVTGGDLIAVQQNFGNVGPPSNGALLGDANDDGQVTGGDLISVQQNFGNALAASASTVPEPTTLVLLVGCIGVLIRRRSSA